MRPPKNRALHTTFLWYYRAVHAAITGGAGKLSGPFAALDPDQQAAAIGALLALPDDIALPDNRSVAAELPAVIRRRPKLNALNAEAVAAARALGAHVLLSPPAADGVLPAALDTEGITWATLRLSRR